MLNKPNPYHNSFERWEPDVTNKTPGELARFMNAFMKAGFTREEAFNLTLESYVCILDKHGQEENG